MTFLRSIGLLSLSLPLLAFAEARRPATRVKIKAGDCERVNVALRALPAKGGTIQLGAGTFLCHEPIVIDRDDIALIGAGIAKTVIKAADATPMPVVVIGSMRNTDRDERGIPYPDRVTRNIVLRDLTIDGNYKTHKDPGGVECYDPTTKQSLNCSTDAGLFIRNNSLTIRRAEHVRVSDILTRGAFSGGIVLEKKNVDVVMERFQSTANYFDGFAGYETTKSRFADFDVFENQFSGLSVDWGFEGNIFEGGIARKNGDNGFFSQDVGGNIYKDLQLIENGNLPIYIAGYFDKDHDNRPMPHTCDGNQMIGIRAVGVKGGIVVNSPCEGTIIKDVHVTQAQGNCLWSLPGAKGVIEKLTCSDGTTERSIDQF